MDKMGKSFDEDMLKSPLYVGAPRNEPGPEPHNNPVAMPDDPLRIVPGNARKAGKKSGL